jgi:hypothetical protein
VKAATLADMPTRSYRLTVQGELSDNLELAFPGMTLTSSGGNTALTGDVRDQAELQGLLQRVSGLGLTLLEAKALDDPPSRQRDVDPAREGGAMRHTAARARRGAAYNREPFKRE